MIDFRPVLQVSGWLLCVLAVAMLVPTAVDKATGQPEWLVFLGSAGATLFVGMALVLGTRPLQWRSLTVRQAYLATTMAWLVPIPFAALPFIFGPLGMSITDAVFEAASGITTTGSTVIAGLDRLPLGLLLWRGLLQWLGGIGIIVMAVAVLPVLNIGGMQMFRIEMVLPTERGAPRAARIGIVLVAAYLGLSAFLALALWLVGLSGFDAIVHAMSTIATGGFSNYDTSIAHFDSMNVETVMLFGMILGGMPFLLFFQLARGNWRTVARDQQMHWYMGLLLLGSVAVALWMIESLNYDPGTAFRHGAFTVVSVMTGTGLVTVDYSAWVGMPVVILLFLTFIGGCAGSTTAGIKVFRLQFLFVNALVQVRHLLRPHAVLIPTFNRKVIPEDVLESVMGFLFVYVMAFAGLAMALGFLGLDFITAISGAAAAISNVGPGLGPTIGPDSTFGPLPALAKWLLAAGMVFGRLEMFTILVLFVPSFWKQ